MSVHGFRDDVVWDDAALPESFWQSIRPTPTDCWEPKNPRREVKYMETIVSRLLRVRWIDVLAAVPTCGNVLCCNPAHTCVTLRNELSVRDAAMP